MTATTGSWLWMAPEVLAGSRYSEKADVYSFSMVLWELVRVSFLLYFDALHNDLMMYKGRTQVAMARDGKLGDPKSRRAKEDET